MRVGLVVYGGLDRTSGGYLYDRKIVERLRAAGDTVTVVALPERPYSRRLLDNVRPSVRQRLAELSVDLLLQDELCHPSLALVNATVSSAPIVSIVHHLRSSEPGPRWRARGYRAIERRYLATVEAFVYSSHAVRSSVEALIGTTNGRVTPPAGDRFDPEFDDDAVATRARLDGPLRVAFLGNLIPRKGLHTLVEAIARLPEDTCRLTAIGDRTADPEYTRRIRRLLERRGLTDAVTLTGRLQDEAVAARLADHHVLAVPSTYEGFGIVYLEGMGFGLPSIATAAGGASEIVTHGENGFLIPPGSPTQVAEALQELATDRSRLTRMGIAARRRYEAHPGWAETTNRIRSFLRTLAEGSDAPSGQI